MGEFADKRGNDHQIRQIGPNMIEYDGRTEVDKLNEMFNLDVPTGDYETIAEYVLELEKRLPEIGAQIEDQSLSLTIADADARTIRQIRVRKRIGPIKKR